MSVTVLGQKLGSVLPQHILNYEWTYFALHSAQIRENSKKIVKIEIFDFWPFDDLEAPRNDLESKYVTPVDWSVLLLYPSTTSLKSWVSLFCIALRSKFEKVSENRNFWYLTFWWLWGTPKWPWIKMCYTSGLKKYSTILPQLPQHILSH